MKSLPRNVVLAGTAEQELPTLLPESVDAIVCSPPYFRLRSYGLGAGELGQEPTADAYIVRLRLTFLLAGRVLKDTGSLWVNIADSYSRHTTWGAPPKSLLGIPQRLMLGLIEDGWICRNVVVWNKFNGLPQSARDRLTPTTEVVIHLTRSASYFYDLDSIREPHRSRPKRPQPAAADRRYQGGNGGLAALAAAGRVGAERGKNPGDSWSLPAANFRGAHFATFPRELVSRPILATVPEAICVQCDRPFTRDTRICTVDTNEGVRHVRKVGELRRCDCFAPIRPGIVLDPFCGTNVTGEVAERLGRDWLGIEPSAEYRVLAAARMSRSRRRPE